MKQISTCVTVNHKCWRRDNWIVASVAVTDVSSGARVFQACQIYFRVFGVSQTFGHTPLSLVWFCIFSIFFCLSKDIKTLKYVQTAKCLWSFFRAAALCLDDGFALVLSTSIMTSSPGDELPAFPSLCCPARAKPNVMTQRSVTVSGTAEGSSGSSSVILWSTDRMGWQVAAGWCHGPLGYVCLEYW